MRAAARMTHPGPYNEHGQPFWPRVHGFGHPRFDELLPAHIAYDDMLVLIDDLPGVLIQGILAPASAQPTRPSHEWASGLVARLIRVVPHPVDFDRSCLQPRISLALYLQAQRSDATDQLATHDQPLTLPLIRLRIQLLFLFSKLRNRGNERAMNRPLFGVSSFGLLHFATVAAGSRRP
jgi:hypothetical protein